MYTFWYNSPELGDNAPISDCNATDLSNGSVVKTTTKKTSENELTTILIADKLFKTFHGQKGYQHLET